MMSDAIRAVILGIVEGVTEFLPVSSTGHLLLAERFFDLGEDNFWKSFAVLIQLGAILAILALYFGKLWHIALNLFKGDAAARRFVIGVLIAFLPAAIIGAAAGGYVKSYLFNPWVVCFR
jgi:undecaprenyl-diphosphatase